MSFGFDEPIEPDYDEYLHSQRLLGKRSDKPVLSESEYLAMVEKVNKIRTEKRETEAERVRKANHLLFRTKHRCLACGGVILHRYQRLQSHSHFSMSDSLIGPGDDDYGRDSSPILGKEHLRFECKNCGLVYARLTKATRPDLITDDLTTIELTDEE